MGDHYILEGHDVVPCSDLTLWGQWHSKADRKVKRENIGDSDISTVFLGLDHAWDGGPPLVFETFVFGGPLDGEMDRYTTWDDAINGHKAMVKKVNEASAKNRQ